MSVTRFSALTSNVSPLNRGKSNWGVHQPHILTVAAAYTSPRLDCPKGGRKEMRSGEQKGRWRLAHSFKEAEGSKRFTRWF